MDHLLTEYFTGQTATYAELLLAEGDITVYVPAYPETRIDGTVIPVKWFHYQIGENFGTYAEAYFGELSHTMPTKGNVKTGNAIVIVEGAVSLTVEAARKTARPSNHGLYVDGAFANERPWGIGDNPANSHLANRYVPFVRHLLPGTDIDVPKVTYDFVVDRIKRDFGDDFEPVAFTPAKPNLTGWIDLVYYNDESDPVGLVLAISPEGKLEGTTTLTYPEG